MKKIFGLLLFVIVSKTTLAQCFEMGSGWFFVRAEGTVYYDNYNSSNNLTPVTVNSGGVFTGSGLPDGIGLSASYYKPFLKSGSGNASFGVDAGLNLYLSLAGKRVSNTYVEFNKYGSATAVHTKGFQIPIIALARLGNNATNYGTSNMGIGVGIGVMPTGFSTNPAYNDKVLYVPPVVMFELAGKRMTWRFTRALLPKHTYYIQSSGKKELRYDLTPFSITMVTTFGKD